MDTLFLLVNLCVCFLLTQFHLIEPLYSVWRQNIDANLLFVLFNKTDILFFSLKH